MFVAPRPVAFRRARQRSGAPRRLQQQGYNVGTARSFPQGAALPSRCPPRAARRGAATRPLTCLPRSLAQAKRPSAAFSRWSAERFCSAVTCTCTSAVLPVAQDGAPSASLSYPFAPWHNTARRLHCSAPERLPPCSPLSSCCLTLRPVAILSPVSLPPRGDKKKKTQLKRPSSRRHADTTLSQPQLTHSHSRACGAK